MTDHPDRERIRPTLEGRARLLAAVDAVAPPHVVDLGTLGEYAELVTTRGRAEAEVRLPEVAAHLADGCSACDDDLRELTALAGAPDPGALTPQPPLPAAGEGSGLIVSPSPTAGRGAGGEGTRNRSMIDSGIHVADLPDPRAAEAAEMARRQRLRRVRDWLLIAAAVSILLIGLSLIGLAYSAREQAGPARLGLTAQPAESPAPGGAGRVAPSGMSCPPSHPLKGNRSSMIYHRPGGDFYDQTRPEDCFASPADAEAAGYRASQR